MASNGNGNVIGKEEEINTKQHSASWCTRCFHNFDQIGMPQTTALPRPGGLISDAKITITDPKPGAKETLIIISGTPEQAHAAQSLIQAFVISESEGS
ncbi:hypothetical protein Ccrd_014848 [Cynara cardunculus var. scolymus]|uniref:K Homology domain-containing protein n=1 Tax=Cynara cardunculus var. scolymus TaxID=59895 RepID=A0A118K400_CYNCS|nr:hypothetical protein Ccrd_014848 [Cynara cardunculus var. scolymus]